MEIRRSIYTWYAIPTIGQFSTFNLSCLEILRVSRGWMSGDGCEGGVAKALRVSLHYFVYMECLI